MSGWFLFDGYYYDAAFKWQAQYAPHAIRRQTKLSPQYANMDTALKPFSHKYFNAWQAATSWQMFSSIYYGCRYRPSVAFTC